MTERDIFLNAIERPKSEREAYLKEACGGNSDLLARVTALLASHDGAGSFLGQPLVSPPDPEYAPTKTFSPGNAAQATRSEDEAAAVAFLAPPGRPDSLGRIGHYEVLQILGHGGFGIVFRAFDEILQRVVAVKVMTPQLASTSPARKRFLREAQSSAQVRHENVVQVYEVGETPLPFLVMEFIPGETLQQRLDRVGPLEVAEAVRIGRQIAEGLAAAHATDLIHRDIKPGNVIIEGGQHRVKITDFGLARAADDASISQSGIIAGTPMYMAPEQALGQKLDQRADLFSLGSVLYQMVAGRPPFRANNTLAVLKRVAEDTPRSIREIVPETPQWLCNIIEKLHAKNPDDRYLSARDVADVLADCEAQLKTNPKLSDFSRIPQAKPAPRSPRRMRHLVAPLLLLFTVALVVAGYFAFVRPRTAVLAVEASGADVQLTFLNEQDGSTYEFTEGEFTLPPGFYRVGARSAPDRRIETILITEGTHTREADKETFQLKVLRGDSVTVKVRTLPLETEPGWLSLFNGKDLTGWKTHPEQPGTWEVKDGILVGSARQSHLFSERADFANFHLRAQVKINQGGDGGIRFRTPFKLLYGKEAWQVIPYGGYEAEFTKFINASAQTGSVWRVNLDGPPNTLFRSFDPSLPRADEWCAYEVIADGNRFITMVDGKVVADCTDPVGTYSTGHFALQCFSVKTYVQFRKIEIKELPSKPPASDGFVSLFNGKDLTGWRAQQGENPRWRVEKNGELVGFGDQDSYLYSGRGDYRNFHFRAEVFAPSGTDSGVFLRSALDRVARGEEITILGGTDDSWNTGSVWGEEIGKVKTPIAPVGEWFTLEVIAQGRRIVTRVNGRTAVDWMGQKDLGARPGHLALQYLAPAGARFRKIEIKELPDGSAAAESSTFKNSIGMEFVKVPKGKSWLGGGADKPGEQQIEIAADFFLGRYEVTQEEWEKIMAENPSHFRRKPGSGDPVKGITDADLKRFPVDSVTWDQCQVFIEKLNKLEKTPGWVYRLPREEEWEYACRGGPKTDKQGSAFDFYLAQPTNTLGLEQANYGKDTGLNRTSRTGSYEPNPLGLFDMHGNVWEWCDDVEKGEKKGMRTMRGGGWNDTAADCTAVKRALKLSSTRYSHRGLRLARVPAEIPAPTSNAPPDVVAPLDKKK